MSLEAFFKSLSMTTAVRDAQIKGVTEICPANASFQVKFDPDVISAGRHAGRAEAARERGRRRPSRRSGRGSSRSRCSTTTRGRTETLMRFRERHQDPKSTDIEYRRAHQRLRLASTASSRRIPARPGSSRWSASSPACPSSTRWSSASGRSRCRSICAPAPTRRSSPSAIGGCFGCIYSVRGAGGYQMFGITPMPIYDPNQEISYLRDFMVLLQARRHRQMEADRPRRL